MSGPADRYTDKTFSQLESRISKMYREAQKDLRQKLADFTRHHKIKDAEMLRKLKAGEITQAQYQQWITGQVFVGNQWKQKIEQINTSIKNLMQEASNLSHGKSMDVFAENANYVAYQLERDLKANVNFGLYDASTVSRLVGRDPEILPRRVVNGKKLEAWETKKISNAISQGIIQGEGVDQIADRIARDTCIAADKSSVMYARTAITAAQNAGRIERLHEAEEMGIRVQKRWMATLDDRTRDSHAELDGQTVDVDEDFVAYNRDGSVATLAYPGDPSAPFEQICNCRCTMVYVYPDFQQSFERSAFAGYDEEGHKLYETIKDMSYKEWKNSKSVYVPPMVIPEGPTPDQIREERINNILNSGTVRQMTPDQEDEFEYLVKNMNDEHVELYEQMTKFHDKNNYENGPGWYDPSKKKVEMTLKSNHWEKVVGRTDTAAWKTKFHEELHQLDHILGITQGYGTYSDITKAVPDMWGGPTPIGERLKKAIESDILKFLNDAIDDRNATGESPYRIKHVDNLSKPIPRNVKGSFFDRLAKLTTRDRTSQEGSKNKALISAFTDAVGLATNGRLDAYSEGYWGHKSSYQKERGMNGATSECFAEIGSHIMRGDTEALDALRAVMPESVKEYENVLGEILSYMRSNDIHY